MKFNSEHHLPHLHLGHRQMEFAPVLAEDDSLLRAIEAEREEVMQLEDVPDTEALATFWGKVTDDLRADPLWELAEEDEE